MQKLLKIWKQNKLLRFMIGYGILYLLCFFWLEKRQVPIHIVSSRWDGYIPFCEYFVIPYFYWFIYMAFAMVYFILRCEERKECRNFVFSFCVGMTLFLLISYFYPNGHTLRPELVRDNLCSRIVGFLHGIDTPTNILPSMHVYVTVACTIALLRQKELCRHKGFRPLVWISCVLITLSTMFLKQHSVVDVVLALLLNGVCYVVVYKLPETEKRRKICKEYS